MPDNVISSSGPLVVGTKEDPSGVQHQKMIPEFLAGNLPVPVAPTSPQPTENPSDTELLKAILVELRVQNSMIYALLNTEVEPVEMMRSIFKDMPVTP